MVFLCLLLGNRYLMPLVLAPTRFARLRRACDRRKVSYPADAG
jgi:hypothetical protein